ncbi:hypothetical protein [uncultured Stenotrophomonas sp.]|uniref:hypothetical protein n=1 Tax=uncultured Stenotrophomonas sp. TaxID=165438 RepID=UPI002804AA81|nr:hypothetical protein [uncultured Stenotrophomonas sp.]
MTQKHIDQEIRLPNGKIGVDAYDAFAIVNENSQDAEQRLSVLEASGQDVEALKVGLQQETQARAQGDDALGQRIDAEQIARQVQAEALGWRIIGDNAFINGDFRFWERGTSFAAPAYTADRWYFNAGGVESPSVIRNPISPGQFASIRAPAFARVSYGAVTDPAGHYVVYEQLIEDAGTYAGEAVTISFKVYNSGQAGRQIALELRQNFGSGGSASLNGIGSKKFALAAGLNTITHTVQLPSVVGKTFGPNNSLGFAFWASAGSNWNARNDSLGAQTGDVHFTEVKIERGATATSFQQRPEALERLLCQRYCYAYEVTTGNAFVLCHGLGNSQVLAFLEAPTDMRTIPTARSVGAPPTLTGVGMAGGASIVGQSYIPVSKRTVALVATANQATTGSASGYLGSGSQPYRVLFEAEL